MSILHAGQQRPCPDGLNVVSYVDDHEVRALPCMSPRYALPLDEVMIHESVTMSSPADGLFRRGLGVHFCILPDGRVEQHVDLRNRCAHTGAGDHNRRAVGVEIVNPYYKTAGPWEDSISAPWADKRNRYSLPTPEQCRALALLVRWLVDNAGIPLRWPGLGPRGFHLGGFAKEQQPASGGIWCHHYTWEHADGAWECLFLYLALENGLSPDEARAEAARLADGSKGWVKLEV